MNKLIEAYGRQKQDKKIDALEKKIETLEKNLPQEKNKVTIGVQLLIFYYLDLINKIDISSLKKAKILKYIFKTDGEENIRKSLSNINSNANIDFKEPFTESNLKEVISIFEEIGLENPLKMAENDLEKKISNKK